MSPLRQSTIPALPDKNPPCRVEFVQAVKTFKKTHRIKLKDFLVKSEDPSKTKLKKEFFAEPSINGYLSRNSAHVRFSNSLPVLDPDKFKKEVSDYYECRVYRLVEQQDAFFPFSRDVQQDTFYSSGALDAHRYRYIQNSGKVCKVYGRAVDIYKIAKRLRKIQLERFLDKNERYVGKFQFVLISNWKDGHATTILSVIHKETCKPLVAIHINSSFNNNYHAQMESRFNSDSIVDLVIFPEENAKSRLLFQKITEHMQFQLAGKTVLIDEKKREAFAFNDGTLIRDKIKILSLIRDGKIDFFHEMMTNENYYQMNAKKNIPFINGSHHLQTEPDDGNCSLYSFNFMQAIVDLLESDLMSQQIYQLALTIDEGSDEEIELAKTKLAMIFSEDLKSYLPCYYTSDKKPKEPTALKEFHLRQRWDINSLHISSKLL